MIPFSWLIIGSLILCICDSYRILVVYPFSSKSHGILGDEMVRYLLEGGHEITYITAFPKKNLPPNLHQVDVSANEKVFRADTMDIKTILNKDMDYQHPKVLFDIMTSVSEATITNDNVQKLLKDPKQEFDLVLAEWMFSEMYSVFSAVYGCPLIWFSSLDPHWMILSIIDETLNPAYNSDYQKNYDLPFTFLQRVSELWNQIKWRYYRNYVFFYRLEKVYETSVVPILRARRNSVPSFEELRYNASLVLGNSHYSLGHATRLPQNYRPIGGYHIRPTVKPMPKDLQIIMNNSANGVIYFSMGTNFKSIHLPDELKQNILKVFAELNQTVLWKFEEELPNLPANVHILKWAPQLNILSHQNCKLFITHGGLLSIAEATHYGVPFIGIPVFADQFKNIDMAVSKGIATKVDLSYTMSDELKTAIMKMISDSGYQERMKEISSVYHDRPVTPGKEILHWVDHVVRTKGAMHLRSPALMVPWYQKIYLDLIVIIFSIGFWLKILFARLYCKINVKSVKNKID